MDPSQLNFLSRIIFLSYSLILTHGNDENLAIDFSVHTTINHLCDLKNDFTLNLKPIFEKDDEILFVHSNGSVLSCIEACCKMRNCEKVYFADTHCFGVAQFQQLNYVLEHPPELPRHNIAKREIPTENSSKSSGKKCEYGLSNCPENESCEVFNDRRRDGVCKCIAGYVRYPDGICNLISTNNSVSTTSSIPNGTDFSSTYTSLPPLTSNMTTTRPLTETPIDKLVVSIKNKTVELEEGSTKYKSATLSAFALGGHGASYTYKWALLDKPDSEDDGSNSDMNSQTITLTNLISGIYIFKVEVTGENAYGEATGNITVITAKHRNKPPIAIIVPASQRVTLPNSRVILDGSGSTDDGEIVSFHWDLITGPIGYKLSEDDGKTLELNNLVAGNFTVMLRVKDDASLEGNATAIVLVEKETDYPPTANAGGDKMIFLPQTETTLYGNGSSDDHGIVEWEWTKGPEDSKNAVDMQDTRTPLLHLSNLEEGHYHFILKVVDTAGHSANSSAHVYVHSSADNVPQANAGNDITIVLPVTKAILDASNSTGISPQTHFVWTQISGPSSAQLSSIDQIRTNVSELTRGEYVFKLTLWNEENPQLNSTSTVNISVKQDKNQAPIAKAGTDFSVTLPVSAVVVNGSESSDDVKIVKWLWERDSMSLAAGSVVKNSDHSPVLLLTGVVPGRYVWNLSVWDEQGASSMDTVSIIVKDGPHHLDEVELVIGVGIESFSADQKKNLIQKLELLLHSNSDVSITVSDILGRPQSGETRLILLGTTNGKVIHGPSLANQLKTKIILPSNTKILDIPILDVYTVVCQNNCSGHGECIQSTRECRCDSWWMESTFRRHFGDGTANCDWSVIYVFVGSIGSALLFGLLIWLSGVLIIRKVSKTDKRKKSTRYSLLDSHEESKVKVRVPGSLLDSATDSDSDNEILFDSRKQRLLKNDKIKNGHIKLQRIRT